MENLKNCFIVVDTSALMHDGASDIFLSKYKHLLSPNTPLYIPTAVAVEINKLLKSNKHLVKKRAKNAAKIYQKLNNENLIQLIGNKNSKFADKEILIGLNELYTKGDIAFICYDKHLCIDVLKINNHHSVRSNFSIRVFNLVKINFDKYDLRKFTLNNFKNKRTPRFKIGASPRLYEKKIDYDIIIKEGDFVISNYLGKKIKLETQLGKGGEGFVYSTSENGIVCKIYKKETLTQEHIEKIEKMISFRNWHNSICWPLDIVYSKEYKPVGIIMNKAKGIELQKSIFIPMKLKKEYSYLSKLDIVNYSISILKSIDDLHKNNVILGDINPLNIMIDFNSKNIFLIDCDSYQIEDFPCPVGTINYTPPELQGQNFKNLLRNFNNEYFSIATLVFMMLLPGKPPYSQQGGDSQGNNIKNMDFSYPLGSESNKKTPEGSWRFMWSHLPYKLKNAFYNCFRKNKRIKTEEWINLLEEYKHNISNNYVSNEIFPAYFKIPSSFNPQRVKCEKCSTEYQESKLTLDKLQRYNKPIICWKCRRRIKILNYENKTEPEEESSSSNNEPSGYISLTSILKRIMRSI